MRLKKLFKKLHRAPLMIAKKSTQGHIKLLKKTSPTQLAMRSIKRKKAKQVARVPRETIRQVSQPEYDEPIRQVSNPSYGEPDFNNQSDDMEQEMQKSNDVYEHDYREPFDGGDDVDNMDEGLGFAWGAIITGAKKVVDKIKKSKEVKKAKAKLKKDLGDKLLKESEEENYKISQYRDRDSYPRGNNQTIMIAGIAGVAVLAVLLLKKGR